MDEAEALLRRDPAVDDDDFDIAILWYIRANAYMEQGRYAEAAPLAAHAAAVFREYGGHARDAAAQLVDAACRMFCGDARGAFKSIAGTIDGSRAAGDMRMLAHALQTATTSLVELGEFEAVAKYGVEAHSLFEAQGRRSEYLRADWRLATVALRSGSLYVGTRQLARTRQLLAGEGRRS